MKGKLHVSVLTFSPLCCVLNVKTKVNLAAFRISNQTYKPSSKPVTFEHSVHKPPFLNTCCCPPHQGSLPPSLYIKCCKSMTGYTAGAALHAEPSSNGHICSIAPAPKAQGTQ